MNNNLPATKADLNKALTKLATKEELKREATKLATKDELKAEVAKLDQKIDKLDHKIDMVEMGLRGGFKFEIDKAVIALDDKNKKYHDDLMTKFDDFLKEIRDSREERTIVSHRLSDHEDRILILEQTAGLAA